MIDKRRKSMAFKITDFKGYLIDLDGTAYRGTQLITETLSFVKRLEKQNIPYLFLTNNSTKTPDEAVKVLRDFGYPVTVENIYTSSVATADYIMGKHPNALIYAIGENGVIEALKDRGLTIVEAGVGADYVVMGLDRAITYEKLTQACFAIRSGAKLIVTNGDKALPTERGFLPGNGAMASVVIESTGTTPIIIGKPNSIIMEKALDKIGLKADQVAMIGDNYNTDILAGINNDIACIYIEGGVTTKEELLTFDKQPTYVLTSLDEAVD